MASSPSPHTRGPARGLGQVGRGLSTYLAPRRKQHLLRFEASILCCYLSQGGPRGLRGVQAWAGQAVSLSYSRHSGLEAAEGGASVATRQGRRMP